jgi:predicted transposase YbfD/YdcC
LRVKFSQWTQCIVKKTLEEIVNTKNDAIVQIKRSQPTIYSETIGITEQEECISQYYERIDKGHGRIVSRRARVFEVPKVLKNTCSEWKEVKCIIEVKRVRKEFDTKAKEHEEPTVEYSYYVSTRKFTAVTFLKAIKDHWKIENKNHYVKDVTMNEDKSRNRKNPTIFAIIRSFVLNILRLNNFQNISLAIFSAGINLDKLLALKGIA